MLFRIMDELYAECLNFTELSEEDDRFEHKKMTQLLYHW